MSEPKKDLIPGGLGDDKSPSDFPADARAKGEKVELEHTSNPAIAEEITRDHLSEDVNYYDKLEEMEAEDKVASAPRLMGYLDAHALYAS